MPRSWEHPKLSENMIKDAKEDSESDHQPRWRGQTRCKESRLS